jgi:hypothetical protein
MTRLGFSFLTPETPWVWCRLRLAATVQPTSRGGYSPTPGVDTLTFVVLANGFVVAKKVGG